MFGDIIETGRCFLAIAWRRLIRRAATSPGRLTTLTAVVVVFGLAFGLAGVFTMRASVGLVSDVTDRSGPLSLQAQDIYRSLSDADATAATAFLGNGVEPAQLRKRYLDDIARASSALTVALHSAEGRSATALGVLVRQIPVYTGLVESARTYNRQGIPLGGAYLREASALMRQTILPAAQDLFRAEATRLSDAQRAVGAVAVDGDPARAGAARRAGADPAVPDPPDEPAAQPRHGPRDRRRARRRSAGWRSRPAARPGTSATVATAAPSRSGCSPRRGSPPCRPAPTRG